MVRIGGAENLQKTRGLDKLAPEPAIQSCDSGQQIPCFDSFQLTIIWMFITKLNTGYRLPYQIENVTFHTCGAEGRAHGCTVTLLPKFLGCSAARRELRFKIAVSTRGL